MSAHTPGPWFAVNRGTKKEPMMSVMAARIAGQKPGHEVAMCATGDSSQEMENANAALIAAAPELLEALESVLAFLEPDSLLDQAHDARLRIDAENAIEHARDIVAKARGAA